MKAEAMADGLVFTGDLSSGHVAYVDGAAASAGGDVDAFVVEAGGAEDDPQVALGALVAPIRDALAGTSGPTEVTADGAVGAVIRSEREQPVSDAAPSVVVDLTGDPSVLRASTQRLADLGTLVLAGPATAQLDLDLYPDVHVRGLRLVGAPGPLVAGTPVAVPPHVGGPAAASVGVAVPSGAAWYRVTVGASGGNS
jgi:hypothetical protein